MAADLKLADVLQLAQRRGLAHNNGAGGQYLLCATEAQLMAFAGALAAPTAPAAGSEPEAVTPSLDWLTPELRERLSLLGIWLGNQAIHHKKIEDRAVIAKWCSLTSRIGEFFDALAAPAPAATDSATAAPME